MTQEKGVSRRDFLLGGMRRLQEFRESSSSQKLQEEPTPVPTANKQAVSQAREILKKAEKAYAKEDYQEAAGLYRQYIKVFPKYVQARKRLAYCLYTLGQYPQAKVELRRVLSEVKNDNFSFLYLGLVYCRLGKKKQAANAWEGYYNIKEVRIMREINMQRALLESDECPDPMDMAEQVEEAIAIRKEELLSGRN